jgi:hypothetical protein
MSQYYYSTSTGKTYSSAQMLGLFGINVETMDVEVLNGRGFYPVQPSAPNFDTLLYNTSSTWELVPLTPSGEGAQLSYTAVAKPLPEAKENASIEVKAQSNAAAESLITSSGVNVDIWTGAASQSVADRPPVYTTLLNEMTTIGDTLASNLAAIDSATTVDEINCIVEGASGIINTSRGGAGNEDLSPSYFTNLQGLPPGVGEPELEIYIPGTDTVISYDPFLPEPYKFDSFGNCYNVGDYRTVIRIASTGQVLSTVTPDLEPNVDIPWTYNPVIPPAPGGGSSSEAF